MAAVAARLIFGLPWLLAIALGFCLGAVSPAVLVPSCMALHKAQYGTKKGIPTTLIAASSFDDIAAITIFGVCITLLFESLELEVPEGETAPKKANIASMIGQNFLEIFSGLAYGFVVAFILSGFNYVHCASDAMLANVKCVIMVGMSVCTPLLAYIIHYPEGKYIGIIFFGYGCNCFWKTKKQMLQKVLAKDPNTDPAALEFDHEDDENRKPEQQLARWWEVCKPCLFGTVGASIKFSDMDMSLLGLSFVVIVIGVGTRWGVCYLVCGLEGKFTRPERILMASAWIPKATVQAALSYVVLQQTTLRQDRMKPEDVKDFKRYGLVVLTTAVFAVILSAPAGAILVNSLGTKLLTYDGPPKGEGAEAEEEAAPEASNKVVPAKPEVGALAPTETCDDAGGDSEFEAEATGKVSIKKSHDYERQPAPNSMPTRKFLAQISAKFSKKPADANKFATM